MIRKFPKITISLIAINFYIFIAFAYFNFLLFPVDYLTVSDDFSYYLASIFSFLFHHDLYHLLGNIVFLWIFGSYMEDRSGRIKFLLFYCISAIGATLPYAIVEGEGFIGASGAISGIMGIYFYRCFHARNNATIPVQSAFRKVHINAKWLLIIWIFRDISDVFHAVDVITPFVHVGGFLTGFVIGKVNSYLTGDDRETDTINEKWGLTEAEEDLLKILKIDPDNPEVNLQLARYFSDHNEKKEKGRKYYLAAARAFYLHRKNKSMAGEVFLEYIERYHELSNLQIHLKYANALADVCNYYSALKVLEPLINTNTLKGAHGEKIFLYYIEYSLKADLKGSAHYVFEKFKKDLPASKLIRNAESLISSYQNTEEQSDDTIKDQSSGECLESTDDRHDSNANIDL